MALSQGGQGQGSIFTEINITPLTDIFLVLLIMMMVIAPTFQNAQEGITPPKIASGQSIEDNKVTVEITKEGTIFLNGAAVSPASLVQQLRGALPAEGEKHVIVKADENTESSQVTKVYKAAGEAGFEKMTIAGEPLSSARQNELQNQPAKAG